MAEPPREDEEALRPDDAEAPEEGGAASGEEGVAANDAASEADGEGEGDAQGDAPVDVPADGQDGPEPAAPSAGALLREAREGRGLALEDLARTLNLHPRIVAALEADDHATLPAAPFVRGYLRSYARLMGMDPAPLLEDHDRRTGGVVVEVRPTPRVEEPVEGPGLVHKRPGTIMVVATLGFVVVVAGALLLLRPEAFERPGAAGADASSAGREAGPDPRRTRPPVPVPVVEPVIESASTAGAADGATGTGGDADTGPDAAGAAAAPAAQADPETPVAPPVAADREGPEAAEAADPRAPDPGAGAADAAGDADGNAGGNADADGDADGGILRTRTADGRGLRVYAGGEDHLHFTFSEDCWVEVSDGDDVRVFQELVRDGEALDLWGRAPFRIRLGYAPAVELTYNGSRVALRPFTRNDVASLTLGR